MAATLCPKLLPKQGWVPLIQSVRHGSKAVTRHRKPMHILRQKLMAVTKYIPPVRTIPPGAYPSPVKDNSADDAYKLFLRKNLENLFQECRMIAVAQNNASSAQDMMIFKGRLHKHGISVKIFSNQLTRSFLKDSIYSNMTPLFIGPTVMIVSKEPKVKEMLMSLRSNPQLTLLGACIDNTLLSVEGIVNYSRLPSVTVAQGQLLSGLTMLTSHTASLLQRHPAYLSALLQQHIKQQSPDSSAEGAPAAEEAK